MSSVFTWVRYSDSPQSVNGASKFTPVNSDLPFLYFGNYTSTDAWSETGQTGKFVMGLRFLGTGASNIKVWMDGHYADFWPADFTAPDLRVDLTSAGFDFRGTVLQVTDFSPIAPCLVATTANIPNISTTNIANDTIDGVTLNVGDRILVGKQSDPVENGIWQVQATYTNNRLVLQRASDMSATPQVANMKTVNVSSGSTKSGNYITYVQRTGFDIDSDPILFQTHTAWTQEPPAATVVAATTSNISDLTHAHPVVDGVALNVGDKILVKNQTNPVQNGIYQVASFNNSGVYSYTRLHPYSTNNLVSPFLYHSILQGTQNAGHLFQWFLSDWYPMTPADWNTQFPIGVTNFKFVDITTRAANVLNADLVVETNLPNFSAGSFNPAPTRVFQPRNNIWMTVSSSDSILVRGQTDDRENGVYVPQTDNTIWHRHSSMDSSGAIVPRVVQSYGSLYSPWAWHLYCLGTLTSDIPIIFVPSQYSVPGVTCTVATTGSNLSSFTSTAPSTIDGYSLNVGDVVLVKDQTDPTENGIYQVSTAPTAQLVRSDMLASDGARTDRVKVITASGGTINGSTTFEMSSVSPWTVGTSELRFYNFSQLQYYSACACSSTANVDLTQDAPATLDTVSLTNGMRVLLQYQTNPNENGIYVVTGTRSIGFERSYDLDQNSNFNAHIRTNVTNGLTQNNTWWGLWYSGSATIGTTSFYWVEQPSSSIDMIDVQAVAADPSQTFSGLSIVGSITVTDGQRVLVTGQATQSLNGIYIAHSGAWARAVDMSTNAGLWPQARIYDENSQLTYETLFTTAPSWVLGTTAIAFTELSDLNIFNQAASTWPVLAKSTIDSPGPLDLGSCSLNQNMEAYSPLFAIAVKVPTGMVDGKLRNFRLITSFDTTDG